MNHTLHQIRPELVDRYEYRTIFSEEDDCYICRVTEFASLATHGDTEGEAREEMRALVRAVLEELEADNQLIPQPIGAQLFSGKFNVRIPIDLHRDLALEAQRQGVSLNALVISKLSR